MTPAQLAFVAAFTLTRNGTRAAIAAGYSRKTATAAASRLRRHPDVAAAIEKMRRASAGEPLTPLQYLLDVMNDPEAAATRRMRAAVVAARYVHERPRAGGKKDQMQRAAKIAATGKFAPAAAPLRLVPPRKP